MSQATPTAVLEPDADSLIASLGPYPWIAAAVLAVAPRRTVDVAPPA